MIEIAPPYRVEPMRWADVSAVMAIERTAFTLPWSDYTYRHELLENRNSHYFVARYCNGRRSSPGRLTWLFGRSTRRGPVVAYGGFWLVVGEAHISTIASDQQWRGRGLGELMLLAMIERSIELGAEMVTLEVRVSNTVAQRLYRKYGFEQVGRRPRYYRDNDEDADLMTVEGIQSAAYRATLASLRAALEDRLRHSEARPPG